MAGIAMGSLGLCYGIVQLPLSITMVAIGHQYNDEDLCKFDAPKALLVMGAIGLFIAILYILMGLSFCGHENFGAICAIASIPIIVVTSLVQFGVQIWASVVIFGMC